MRHWTSCRSAAASSRPRPPTPGSPPACANSKERGAIELELIDISDTAGVLTALAEPAALLWLESPTNPLLERAELDTVLRAARERGTRSIVDNTFATSILQQPLASGADIVLHSATKALSGHSDLLMGVWSPTIPI